MVPYLSKGEAPSSALITSFTQINQEKRIPSSKLQSMITTQAQDSW